MQLKLIKFRSYRKCGPGARGLNKSRRLPQSPSETVADAKTYYRSCPQLHTMPEPSFYDLPKDMQTLLKYVMKDKNWGPTATYYSFLQSLVSNPAFNDLPEDLHDRIAKLEFAKMSLQEAIKEMEFLSRALREYVENS